MSPSSQQMMTIAVGSMNRVKVNAVRESFRACFPAVKECNILSFQANSNVPDQPMGSSETKLGAKNRSAHARDLYFKEHNGYPDFSIGLEGGCQDTNDGQDIKCFAWMAIYHENSQKWSYAETASFVLPPPITHLMRSNNLELGDATDMFFKQTNSKQQGGSIAILTNGIVNRTSYYTHALHLAFIPFIHPEWYGFH